MPRATRCGTPFGDPACGGVPASVVEPTYHQVRIRGRGGIRTPKPFRAMDFKSIVFAVSPLAQSSTQSWRRRPESNRRIEVLQTSALPLGYAALPLSANLVYPWADPPITKTMGRRLPRHAMRKTHPVNDAEHGAAREGAQISPSDWKSTCPPARRMLTPSGWLPAVSSARASVDLLAGDRPVR